MSGKIDCIRKACEINDMIFSEIVGNFDFNTERDLEKYILKRFRDFGAGRAYRPIVAGNNSVIHAVPRNRKFRKGFLVLDFGAKYKGWCSDMTRTIFLGRASKREKELYDLVLKCQKRCVSKVKEGVSCFELDVYSRKLLGSYKKYYRHWLGHGVGKKVHEEPKFGVFSNDILKRGDVITIEPGIYVKNKKEDFGIRIEDTLLVKKDGREVLSRAPKRFIEIQN